MPNINEFVGPKPTEKQNSDLEKLIGNKPCSRCDKDAEEYFWNQNTFTMSWTCPDGHNNSYVVA